MNKFTVSIKQDGTWQKLKATPVFPFSWGELLDERLDEAYVTVYDCRQESIPRLTEFMVTIINGEKTKDEYFILASDNSHELPVGSGKYKHEIYLIERTKLLEGVYCSSLTFTNSKGIGYLNNDSLSQADDLAPNSTSELNRWGISAFTNLIKTTNPTNESILFPSALQMGKALCDIITAQPGENVPSNYHIYEEAIPANHKEQGKTSVVFSSSSTQYLYDSTPSKAFDSGTYYVDYYIFARLYDPLFGAAYPSFHLRFYFSAVSNKLPLKRWSITDCITRCCELAEPLFGSEKPKYRLDGVEYDDNGNVIKPYRAGSLAEKYDKVFAPELTLTEDTLREQLKVIFSYVHAEPWLDENDVIQATEFGSTQKSAATSLPYVYNAASSHINEYCTEVRSHAQNLASSLGYAKGSMIDPGNGLFRSTRTDTAYTRITEGNGIAATNKPIYSIEKVVCGISQLDDVGNGSWFLEPVDITPYVFEATEYGANLSSHKGGYPYSKAFAIYYTQGQPNLNGLFFRAPDNVNDAVFSKFSISNILSAVTGVAVDTIDDRLVKTVGGAADLVFSITYKPVSNHFVSHGKSLYVAGETPYIQLYNQSENLVESQYYGENLKGVAARLGNVEKERTFILKNIDDVPKVGQLLDGYAISAVSCELYPFDIKCTVGLSKDFNRISQYVGINSQKRMYEISERNAAQRDILIKETLVIGTKPENYKGAGMIFGQLQPFKFIFDSAIENTGDWRISFAQLSTKKKNGGAQATVSLPIIGRALGNVLTFNFSTKDNYSAGDSTTPINGNSDTQGRWQTDVPYADYYGRAYWADVFLRTKNEQTVFDKVYGAYLTPGDTPGSPNYLLMENHRLRKDNREVLSYNIELEIKTDSPDIIVGSALASSCGLVNDKPEYSEMYHFDNTKYLLGKFDKQYTPHDDDLNGGSFDSSIEIGHSTWTAVLKDDGRLSLNIAGQGVNRGWVLCTPIKTITEEVEDDDGNVQEITYQTGGDILLASNVGHIGMLTLDFYVTKN